MKGESTGPSCQWARRGGMRYWEGANSLACHCETGGVSRSNPWTELVEGSRPGQAPLEDAMRISIQNRGDKVQRPAAFKEL